MTTSSASQQQLTISARQAIDSVLAMVPAPGKIEQCDFPALQEETQDPGNVVVMTTDVPTVQDGHHLIPGPRATSVNEQILQSEQRLIEAVRILLGLPILHNAITVKHYRWIVMSLRDKLLRAGPHEIPHGEAYARLLLRLVERLVPCPNQQDSEYVLYSCRRDYVECLGKLLTDMAEGFCCMHQTGIEDDVYIKNKELHTDYLCYLASRLRGA